MRIPTLRTTPLHPLPLAAAWLTALLAAPASAATPDAGQLLNEQQQLQTRPLERLPQAAPEQEQLIAPAPGAVTVRLRSIRITGADGMADQDELQAQVADAIGVNLDYAGLQQLADRVTQFLRNKGYLLAFAYLPAQELDQGELEIAVQAGRLDSQAPDQGIELHADGTRIRSDILRDTVAAAVHSEDSDGALRTRQLERGLLLLNDLPGIAARSTLEPGTTPGTSRVVIHAQEEPMLGAAFFTDNQGNRYSGEWRATGRLTLNNPGRIGDQASLLLTHARDLNQAALSYRLPVGNRGLQLGASLGYLDYRVGKELAVLEAEGTALTARLNASYPIIRSRRHNLWATVAYDYRRLKDELLQARIQDKAIHSITLGLNGNMQDRLAGRGMSFFSATLTHGEVDLGRNAAHLAADRATAGTHGPYTKANLGLGRLHQLTPSLTFYGALSAQLASTNLDSSEKFILGGPNAIRAYPVGEGSGDSGWLVNLELRQDLPRPAGLAAMQLTGFVDAGGIRLHHRPWTGAVTNIGNDNRYELAGAGIGLNLALPSGISLRASLSTPIGSNPGRTAAGRDSDGRSSGYRFWVQVAATY